MTGAGRRRGLLQTVVVALLVATVVGLQAARDRVAPRQEAGPGAEPGLYVRSPAVMVRAALSFRSVIADAYWIRALQHFGRARLSGTYRYDLLYPLLDLTTSLDPRFMIAYRFGAIFLTEPPPGGPGTPDEAIALLEKGLAANPTRWELAQDIGFVHYRTGDYQRAAEWFDRAASIEGAPNWMKPLVAVTLAQGGSRDTSRRLWQQIVDSAGAEEQWLRAQGERRLLQLDTLDHIDALERIVARYEDRTGTLPQRWTDLIRAGDLPGVPVDPAGYSYQLNRYWGLVGLDPHSPINPLPGREDITFP